VELFEQIRQAYFVRGESKRAIAKRLQIHRRIINQALNDPRPPAKTSRVLEKNFLLTSAMKLKIEEWLKTDKSAPKKQRHTSKRIFQRLVTELHYLGAEPSIRKYVGQLRRELGINKTAFVPLVYQPGEEAEVDWYEAVVNFPTGPGKAQVFLMRACHSGKEFHMAFPRQTQQAFFEGHIAAFFYFGGIFQKIRYDNLTSAVKKVLRGRQRIENETFVLFRSHYLFEAVYCKPGKEGAHEKGGVECGVGRFRRQYFVPVPEFENYEALNAYILTSCNESHERTIIGKSQSIYDDWINEENKLRALPKHSFDSDTTKMLQVNSRAFIKVENNSYSVPTRLVGLKVEAKSSTHKVKVYHQGKQVAEHVRSHKNNVITADLEHYLDLLWQKPGAFSNALPLQQAKEQQRWPACYESFLQILIGHHGNYTGTQQFIEVLMLHREHSQEDVTNAVQWAEKTGFFSSEAITYFIHEHRDAIKAPEVFAAYENLKGFGYSESKISHYDRLIKTTENKGETYDH